MPRGIATENPQSVLLGYPLGYPGLVSVLSITGPHPVKESVYRHNTPYFIHSQRRFLLDIDETKRKLFISLASKYRYLA